MSRSDTFTFVLNSLHWKHEYCFFYARSPSVLKLRVVNVFCDNLLSDWNNMLCDFIVEFISSSKWNCVIKVGTMVAPCEYWLFICLWGISFIHNVWILTSVFCVSVYRLHRIFIHFFGYLGIFHWMCQATLWNVKCFVFYLDSQPRVMVHILQLYKDSVIWKKEWLHSLRLNAPN